MVVFSVATAGTHYVCQTAAPVSHITLRRIFLMFPKRENILNPTWQSHHQHNKNPVSSPLFCRMSSSSPQSTAPPLCEGISREKTGLTQHGKAIVSTTSIQSAHLCSEECPAALRDPQHLRQGREFPACQRPTAVSQETTRRLGDGWRTLQQKIAAMMTISATWSAKTKTVRFKIIKCLFLKIPSQNGVFQAWAIVEIHHSGRKPSNCFICFSLQRAKPCLKISYESLEVS